MSTLRTALLRSTWVAAALALSAGCSAARRDAFEQALAAGDRAKSAGRYDEAAAAYREAGDKASRDKDRDEGHYREGAQLEQAGRYQEAMAAFDRLIARSPGGERTPRAVFDRAFLEVHHGDAEAGWRMVEQALFKYPGTGSARRGLRDLLAHLDEQQKGAGRRWLEANRKQLEATPLGEDTIYLLARALDDEGQSAEARRLYVACAERYPYPYGSLTDDSWWRAAEMAEKLGDYRGAIAHLKSLLAPREVSSLGQHSYERPRYSTAQFRIAEIYRDKLNDDAQARLEFRRFYTDHKTSILRDDALWNEALLARKAQASGEVCSVVESLVKEFPESRYAGCAPQLCPSQKAPDKAPPCRNYLKATLGEPSGEAAE